MPVGGACHSVTSRTVRADRLPIAIAAVVATAVCGAIALTSGDDSSAANTTTAAVTTAAGVPTTVEGALAVGSNLSGYTPVGSTVAPDSTDVPDLDGAELTVNDSCLMTETSVRFGSSGPSVSCLQQALLDAGYYSGAVTGSFDQATFVAAEAMQEDRDLFVDGIVGRESAISLGIWPDEESFVVRTPKPPSGAVDLMGYPLSSVASAGDDAPPLPPDSGSGRRLVFYRGGQRVWAVGDDGRIIRSWLVSGSKYSNELPGTHEVYSRSEMSTAWNGKAYLPKMVRWLKTDIGAIGFHAIPIHRSDNTPYQTEAELGQRLSGGCQRQANRDAAFLWDFAQVGTKVVVI